ncbi:MAG: ABC transporter permease [Candidatus Thorarchaeota archaeon]
MSAMPVGYGSFSGLRRKSVTLLCVLLASTTAMGITVYVDSYSVHEWTKSVDSIGPIGMTVTDDQDNVDNILGDVQEIPGVESAEMIEYAYGEMTNLNDTPENPWDYYSDTCRLGIPHEDYMTTFQGAYDFTSGGIPETDDGIALHHQFADQLNARVGDSVVYVQQQGMVAVTLDLEVVGIFSFASETEGSQYYDYYNEMHALVASSHFGVFMGDIKIHVGVDQTQLSPFNARGSLDFVMQIAENIRLLDSDYDGAFGFSRYYVQNEAANGINQYLNWQMSTRIAQLMGGGGAILLVCMVILLAIRYNVNERRFESTMLMSRGAAKSDIENIILKELFKLSIVGTILGVGVGILLSRIALGSVGFFQFDINLILNEPMLITMESLLISVFVGIFLPLLCYIGYNFFFSTKKRVEEGTGKLSKLTRVFKFLRWDFLLLIGSGLLLIALTASGSLLRLIPLLSFVIVLTPLAMFVGLGSILIKALRRGANTIAKGMSVAVGPLSSSVGIRRIGKDASSAGTAILVLVLAMSFAWTNAIIASSMPLTKTNQAKFAFGADATFHLDSSASNQWANFTQNVTNHELTESVTRLSIVQLYLSAQSDDNIDAIGMDPAEYSRIGYDYDGTRLNESALSEMLLALELNPTGAIVSQDIAESYDLSIDDSLRGFSEYGSDDRSVFAFKVIGIYNALSDARFTDTGTLGTYYSYYSEVVGSRNIWVNSEYLESQIFLENESYNILCASTVDGANGTALVADVLDSGGWSVLNNQNWASVSFDVELYLSQTTYHMDRAVSTMTTIASVAIIFGAFTIYAFEGITARRREIALLRAIGADMSQVIKAQIAELLVLALVSFGLLAIYGPLHITNALMNYSSSTYTFPEPVFITVPYMMLLEIALFFIGSILIFVIAIAALSSRINLSESLNSSWAESGPYGGDV